MSNHYSYHCMDCNESHRPANLNNDEKSLCAVLRFKKQLVQVQPLGSEPGVWDFYLQIRDGHTVPFDFLVEHQEPLAHHLVVLSEYRDHYYEEDGTCVVKEVPR